MKRERTTETGWTRSSILHLPERTQLPRPKELTNEAAAHPSDEETIAGHSRETGANGTKEKVEENPEETAATVATPKDVERADPNLATEMAAATPGLEKVFAMK